ncbi:hypothetical protein ACLB2K_030892 [Fragaria x ananassa]
MMVLKDVENYLKNKEAPVDEKFKRLFVLYTMCTILTPSASLMIPQKWLLLLRDTSLIPSFNWSEHTFKYLMKGIIEAWGDRQADKVMAYTKSKGGLMFAQIEVRKPGDHVCERSEAIDEGFSLRVAILEESFKEYKAQTSEKLGTILSVLEKMETSCKKVEKLKVREFKVDVNMDIDDKAVLDYVYNGVGSELILAECNGQSCKRSSAINMSV